MLRFGDVVTAMVTPFHANGDVNYAEGVRLAEHLLANGTDTLLICGTTGESPTMTWEEKIELMQTVKVAIQGKAPIIFGMGTNCTRESVSQASKAETAGADALLVVVPYYSKPSQEGMYQHFVAIAAATKLPIIIYNIPGRTSVNMDWQTVVRLAAIPNIVGIKESSGSLEQATMIKKNAPATFLLYSGDDYMTLPLLSIGGEGIISVASHIVGKKIKEMIVCFKRGDHTRATELHLELSELFKQIFFVSNPVPIKYAVNKIGFAAGEHRAPIISLNQAEKEFMDGILKSYNII
ncbi:MAG: 4-hydroxy-tetrahydrodipicolinate synthase [Clostridia bacterium]